MTKCYFFLIFFGVKEYSLEYLSNKKEAIQLKDASFTINVNSSKV